MDPVYDMETWPADSNELIVRLHQWFSLNYWLVVEDDDWPLAGPTDTPVVVLALLDRQGNEAIPCQ